MSDFLTAQFPVAVLEVVQSGGATTVPVAHDGTLSGNGTAASPLSVVSGPPGSTPLPRSYTYRSNAGATWPVDTPPGFTAGDGLLLVGLVDSNAYPTLPGGVGLQNAMPTFPSPAAVFAVSANTWLFGAYSSTFNGVGSIGNVTAAASHVWGGLSIAIRPASGKNAVTLGASNGAANNTANAHVAASIVADSNGLFFIAATVSNNGGIVVLGPSLTEKLASGASSAAHYEQLSTFEYGAGGSDFFFAFAQIVATRTIQPVFGTVAVSGSVGSGVLSFS